METKEFPYDPDDSYISHGVMDEMSFSSEFSIDPDLFYNILGVDYGESDETTFTFEAVKYIQKRRHKKKRINKKWMKRYGFVPICVRKSISGNINMESLGDGMYEFTIKNPH